MLAQSRRNWSLVALVALAMCPMTRAQNATQLAQKTQPAAMQPATQPAPDAPAATRPGGPPTLVKGPYLQAMRTDGVVICLEVSQDVSGRIVVRSADGTNAADKPFEATADKIVRIAIDNLRANESYQYSVYLGEAPEPLYASTFKTFPPPGHLPVEFAVTGDSRTNRNIWHNISEAIRKAGVPIVLHTGDYVSAGRTVSLWNPQFFDPARAMLASVTLFPAVGNHELGGSGPDGYAVFGRFFVLPENKTWYSFDYGGVHVTILDSTRPNDPAGEQYKWAETDLPASKAPWKIAVLHHPWFCGGSHESDVPMRRLYGPLFTKAGVDLILVGHDHNYQKTRPIVRAFDPASRKPLWQIVTGGGGAPLYPALRPEVFLDKHAAVNHYLMIRAEKEQLVAVAYGLDGKEFDRLEIRKDAPAEGAVTSEQIEIEQMLRDWLARKPFVFAPGASVAVLVSPWTNALPVPVKLRFTSGGDKRFELAGDPPEVQVPAQADGKPGTSKIRLMLRCLDQNVNLDDLSIRMNAAYDAGKAGSGTVKDIRVPLAAVKAVEPVPAGQITIDGKLEEPAWSQAKAVTGFRDTRKQEPEPFGIATSVRAARGDGTLYLAVACKLPEGWEDNNAADIAKADHVRIDLAAAPGKVLTVLARPNGQVQLRPQGSGATAAAVRGEAGWTVEAAVPVALPDEAGQVHFNVERQTRGKTFSLMPYGSPFNYETAAIVQINAPASRPVGTRPAAGR